MARKVDPEHRALNMRKLDEALLELLKDKEIEQITIKEICDKAGLSKGLFHYYYESKEQILFERLKMINEDIEKAIEDKLTYKDVSKDLDIYAEFLANNSVNRGYKYFRQVYKYLMMHPEKNKDQKGRNVYSYLHKIIQAGQENGEVTKELSCDRICEILFSNLRGLTIQWIISGGELDLVQIVKNSFALIKDGILIK